MAGRAEAEGGAAAGVMRRKTMFWAAGTVLVLGTAWFGLWTHRWHVTKYHEQMVRIDRWTGRMERLTLAKEPVRVVERTITPEETKQLIERRAQVLAKEWAEAKEAEWRQAEQEREAARLKRETEEAEQREKAQPVWVPLSEEARKQVQVLGAKRRTTGGWDVRVYNGASIEVRIRQIVMKLPGGDRLMDVYPYPIAPGCEEVIYVKSEEEEILGTGLGLCEMRK